MVGDPAGFAKAVSLVETAGPGEIVVAIGLHEQLAITPLCGESFDPLQQSAPESLPLQARSTANQASHTFQGGPQIVW